MSRSRVLVTALAAAGITLSLVGISPAAQAAPEAPSQTSAAPTVNWAWRWSDGGTAHRRAFSRAVYGSAVNLPYLVISNDSCASGVLLKL